MTPGEHQPNNFISLSVRHPVLQTLPLILWIALGLSECLGQGAVDGFMKGPGNTDLALSLSQEFAQQYYAGPDLIDFSNTINSIGLFAATGITRWMDMVINLPAVNFRPQDGAIFGKFGTSLNTGKSRISFVGAVGFSTPMSNYGTESSRAIGQQATSILSRGIIQHTGNNYFVQARGGYNYSFEPVPPGYIYSIKTGYFKNKFYGDIWIDFQEAIGGKDYRGQGDLRPNSFRELGVSYTRAGGVFYYQLKPRLGGFFGYAFTLAGRNTFRSTRVSTGLVVKFFPKSSQMKEEPSE